MDPIRIQPVKGQPVQRVVQSNSDQTQQLSASFHPVRDRSLHGTVDSDFAIHTSTCVRSHGHILRTV